MPIYELYEGTSLPAKPSDFDVDVTPKKKRDQISAAEIAVKLKGFSELELRAQEQVRTGIKTTLKRCLDLITVPATRYEFTLSLTISIFHTLPKLPLEISHSSRLSHLLLDRIDFLVENKSLTPYQVASILSAFAKLSLDLNQYCDLIKKLLDSSEPLKRPAHYLTTELLNELWLFLAYANAKGSKSVKIATLYQAIDEELDIRAQNVTTSKFQNKVDDVLTLLLSKSCQQDCATEYPVGAYSLDIAFPSLKLNIEIDGPHHYRVETLSRASQFRDYLLQHLGWKVVRIPYFDWYNITKKQEKIDYLLLKLAAHAYIFDEEKLSRLRFLSKNNPSLAAVNVDPFVEMKQETKDENEETVKPKSEDVIQSKSFISSARFLSQVFAEKLSHKSYVKYAKSGEVIWQEEKVKNHKFFCLKKIKIKEKKCTGLEKVANENDLSIKFKAVKSTPGFYKLMIAKTSIGLLRAKEIAKVARLSNHEDEDNGNSKILHMIRQYER